MPTAGAELRFIEVERDDDLYTLRSVTWFEADVESVYRVLTDYDLFREFSSAIVESRNLAPDKEGRPEYFTRMEGCVLMFCKSFVRIGYLNLEPMSEIVAVTDPERSDFKRATEQWRLREVDGGTLLLYEFEMEPAFWVPPVVGPYYTKRALKSGGEKAVGRIEALAQGAHPPL
jgi:hypothetical protein